MNFGNKLKKLRIDKSETLHNISMGTNIDMTLLSKIERGERLPTVEQLKRIANYFDLDQDILLVEITAERIINDYGMNEATYKAALLVKEKLAHYHKGEPNE